MSQSRYNGAMLVKDEDGDWLSPNTSCMCKYIRDQERSDDTFHTVQQGDRLDLLANEYFGDPNLWWIIAELNNIFWFQDVEEGDVLRIPSFEHVYLDLLI